MLVAAITVINQADIGRAIAREATIIASLPLLGTAAFAGAFW
jgi:hypothetical protein